MNRLITERLKFIEEKIGSKWKQKIVVYYEDEAVPPHKPNDMLIKIITDRGQITEMNLGKRSTAPEV